MAAIVIKRGDTLLISGVYKQSNASPMNLTGYQLEVNIMNANTDKSVITLIAGVNTANRSLIIENAVAGQFKLMVKDTEVLRDTDYYIDFKTTGDSGIEQTSKAIKLSVKTRLV